MPEAQIISIIDDDTHVRAAIQRLVQSLGYAALTFQSADDFLQSGLVAETACVIVEIEMSGVSGLELQERLLAEGRKTPVIFITAFLEEFRARALETGAVGLLNKPFGVESLIDCLNIARSGPKMVFGAASLKDALDVANAQYQHDSGHKTLVSYGASSALAKEIENGAPADIFWSADLDWMDYLEERKLVKPESRFNLLGNKLVLIAPIYSRIDLTISPNFPLARALDNHRLAMADPAVVPAGKYGKAALEALGVWSSVRNKITPAKDARATLALVSRGEAPLGLVYQTDAAADTRVKILGTFPESTHPPIIYPIAITASSSNPRSTAYLNFLKSPLSRPAFEKQGFTVLGE